MAYFSLSFVVQTYKMMWRIMRKIDFTTLKTENFLQKTNNLHSDTTYHLNYCNLPMMILGQTNVTTKFSPRMTVLSSHKGTAAWQEIYGYVHSENIHPSFRMSDGAKLIFLLPLLSLTLKSTPQKGGRRI